jgi:predicted transcriptional regulator of viral defense system
VAITLKPLAYFTHLTAMAFHHLTAPFPKNIYVNFEQNLSGASTAELTQAAIDRAFRNKPRETKYFADCNGFRVHVLNGRKTGQLGVVHQAVTDEGGKSLGTFRLTNLERTLIDIAVRPAYSGGVDQIAKAYTLARGKVTANEIVAMLLKLGYTYPYHQAIGFYMEHAGYSPNEFEPLRKIPMELDFYLSNRITERKYVKKWKIYVPSDLT